MYTVRNTGQRGLVLVFALLVLFLLGLLASAMIRGSVMQLRMARNLETAVLERQQALDEIERILQHIGQQVPEGPNGYLNCTADHDAGYCDEKSLPVAEGAAGSVQSYIRIVESDRPAPRVAEENASSSIADRAVQYEVGAAAGRTTLAQGVLILVPGSPP